MLFSRDRRLKKPAEFSTVYSSNQTRVKGQYFIVLAFSRFKDIDKDNRSATIAKDIARVGVVASKKVSKRAVERNRLKRLMRESFQHQYHPDGFDFVTIALVQSAKVENDVLRTELQSLWKRLHKRCDML